MVTKVLKSFELNFCFFAGFGARELLFISFKDRPAPRICCFRKNKIRVGARWFLPGHRTLFECNTRTKMKNKKLWQRKTPTLKASASQTQWFFQRFFSTMRTRFFLPIDTLHPSNIVTTMFFFCKSFALAIQKKSKFNAKVQC